jgi:hypothetical protein
MLKFLRSFRFILNVYCEVVSCGTNHGKDIIHEQRKK